MSLIMIRLILLVSINFYIFGTPIANAATTPESESTSGNEIKFKFFKRKNNLTHHLQIQVGNSGVHKSLNQIKIGSYFRFFNRQKLGLSTLIINGKRRTDDWQNKNNIGWKWNDEKNRSETLIELDYSRKFSPFVKSQSVLSPLNLELKTSYLFNFDNSDQTLIIKPTTSYFWAQGLIPKYSLHMSLPFYFPINFEQQQIYKSGFYLGGLYHYSRLYQFGVYYRYSKLNWTESEDFKTKKPTQSYQSTEIDQVLGLEVIFQL